MKQAFNIEIIVESEKELSATDVRETLEDMIGADWLDWEVTYCTEDAFITEEDIAKWAEEAFMKEEYNDGSETK